MDQLNCFLTSFT